MQRFQQYPKDQQADLAEGHCLTLQMESFCDKEGNSTAQC